MGTNTDAAVYLYNDGVDFFVRVRVDTDPLQAPANLRPYGWGILIDTDDNFDAYEYSLLVEGISEQIEFAQNTTPTNVGDPSDIAETLLYSAATNYAPGGNVRVLLAPTSINGTQDYFVDFAIPLAQITAAGITSPIRLIGGTSSNGRSISVDVAGSAGTPGTGDIPVAISDPINLDGSQSDVDGDGTPAGTDPDDTNPCVPAINVAACDLDGDGTGGDVDPDNNDPCVPAINVAACDLDGDGTGGDVDPDNNDPWRPCHQCRRL